MKTYCAAFTVPARVHSAFIPEASAVGTRPPKLGGLKKREAVRRFRCAGLHAGISFAYVPVSPSALSLWKTGVNMPGS
jgi:hypothetical protein